MLIGDCVEQMRTLDADSVDAIVTDPPYGLEFMGKAWDGFGTPLGFQTWTEQWAREALRVLKPGGHLLAFGGTRMYHRLAAGIEDAGFEIRDTLMWLYGSGFPKSLDVSKAIDKAAGAEREVIIGAGRSNIGTGKHGTGASIYSQVLVDGTNQQTVRNNLSIPSTEAAKKWEGWGTALKPAVEPIVLARKPLIGTVAENVLTHGTGALNIDASRIGYKSQADKDNALAGDAFKRKNTKDKGWSRPWMEDADKIAQINREAKERAQGGRWPANILLDEEAAALLDEQSDGASRFFYVAKASRAERNKGLEDRHGFFQKKLYGAGGQSLDGVSDSTATRNIHPTVKPVDLMRYLIRLVTPKGGIVLDPFMGSGTTAVAAIEEGVNWIGCEREPEYVAIIEARIAAAQPGMGLNLEEDSK